MPKLIGKVDEENLYLVEAAMDFSMSKVQIGEDPKRVVVLANIGRFMPEANIVLNRIP